MCLRLGQLQNELEENKEENQKANEAVFKKYSHEIGENYL